jgi:hypothetical protein
VLANRRRGGKAVPRMRKLLSPGSRAFLMIAPVDRSMLYDLTGQTACGRIANALFYPEKPAGFSIQWRASTPWMGASPPSAHHHRALQGHWRVTRDTVEYRSPGQPNPCSSEMLQPHILIRLRCRCRSDHPLPTHECGLNASLHKVVDLHTGLYRGRDRG